MLLVEGRDRVGGRSYTIEHNGEGSMFLQLEGMGGYLTRQFRLQMGNGRHMDLPHSAIHPPRGDALQDGLDSFARPQPQEQFLFYQCSR